MATTSSLSFSSSPFYPWPPLSTILFTPICPSKTWDFPSFDVIEASHVRLGIEEARTRFLFRFGQAIGKDCCWFSLLIVANVGGEVEAGDGGDKRMRR
ncbi:hypothetical protein TIFTF001_012030 [Ficus carica]|uniref:Uncharacterized protein n=1 Tax=Ficus carica TaxID=3494 RepID=A0AA88AMP9_FICCA|nr:hypothetical protein TIFTF001_012030 [Ficus carica]